MDTLFETVDRVEVRLDDGLRVQIARAHLTHRFFGGQPPRRGLDHSSSTTA